ncbi:MAG: hypothetical protein IPK69_06550 [Phycisphaerales bacterium]|nr:MAG: hypothetical protein IPK69_06550 [Phycisphaerales bacterium]
MNKRTTTPQLVYGPHGRDLERRMARIPKQNTIFLPGTAILFFGVTVGTLIGCSAGAVRSVPSYHASDSVLVSIGDFDDLTAAMEYTQTIAEVAVERKSETNGVVAFEVATATDEAGRLECRAVDGGIELRARVGLYGDRAREQRILEAMSRRLGQLAGRDWAPVD